jgi:hypothetical protein
MGNTLAKIINQMLRCAESGLKVWNQSHSGLGDNMLPNYFKVYFKPKT